MDRLPTEILLMIFRYIDDHRQRARLERVCHRWRQIMRGETANGKMRWDGWKNVHQVARLHDARWIGPIGERCGEHLIECTFYKMEIDSTLIRLIANQFPAVKHLEFRSCKIKEDLDAKALETFRNFSARLCSLTFYYTRYSNQLDQYFLSNFSRLRHLGFNFSWYPNRISADLRSLYLSGRGEYSRGLEQTLMRIQEDSPRLAALYLDLTIVRESVLHRISQLKNLRFLRIALNIGFEIPEGLLDNLPKLIALRLNLPILLLPTMSRSTSFRGLVHLSLYIDRVPDVYYGSFGFLSTVAPNLRSLHLDYPGPSLELSKTIGSELLKIAHNGILEQLSVPRASFTVEMLDQLIQLCPNLRSLIVQLQQDEQLSQVAELRRVVENQWRTGTRKYLPLRICFYCHPDTSWRYQDPFLSVHIAQYQYGFTPSNPVLDELFRDEVFNDNDGGGTPSFVTEFYSKND